MKDVYGQRNVILMAYVLMLQTSSQYICFVVQAGKGGDLTHDETTIITGALELTEKTARDAMTPITNAFSLDLDANLNLWVSGFLFCSLHHVLCTLYALPPTSISIMQGDLE